MELEGIQFKVEGLSGGSGAGEIKALASALGSLKGSLPTEGRIKSVVNSLKQLADVSSKLKFDSTSISNLGKALSDVSSAKISKSVGDNIRNIGEAARTITDADVMRIKQLADALSGIQNTGTINIKIPGSGSASASGKGASSLSEAQNGGKGTGSEIAKDIASAEGSASSFFATLRSQIPVATMGLVGIGNAFLNASQAVGAGIGRVTGGLLKIGATGASVSAKMVGFFSKDLVGSIAKATSSLGGLLAGLKRIAMYRAMRTIIKMITEGFTTGLKNVYEYSKLVGTQFASSMDQIATSSMYLKNSLGAMAAPLLQALAPAIDFVIDKFVSLLNVINMFIARLTGASVATVAKKTFTPWGDSADKAAGRTKKAVKEIRRTLLGFDEINRLDAPDKSGSNGGGGSKTGGADYGSMFEQVPITQSVSDFADKVKQLFKEAKWEELGTFLGQKFNELVDKVPWGKLGKKVGEGVNGVITTAYYFLKEADFQKLGGKFATFLNNALSKINTNTLGRLLVRRFTVLADLLIGAIKKVNWGQVAEKASDFVIGIFDEASDWLQKIKWGELALDLYNNLVKFIKKVKWAKIGSSIARFLGSAVGAVASVGATIIGKIGEGIAKAVSKIKEWGVKHIKEPFVKGCKTGGFLNGIKEVGKSVFKSIGDGLKSAASKIWNVIGKPFVDAFKKVFKPAGTAGKKIKEVGKNILDAIGKGIKSIINGDAWKWLKSKIFGTSENNQKEKALGSVSIGVGLIQDGWESVKKWFEGLGDKIDLPEPLKALIGLAKDKWTSIKNWWAGLLGSDKDPAEGTGAKLGLSKLWTTIQGWFDSLNEKPASFPNAITVGLKKGWDTIKSWFTKETAKEGKASTTVDVKPQVTGYTTKQGVTKPWTNVTPSIKSYETKDGVSRPWRGVDASINSYTPKKDIKIPWRGVDTSINSYTPKSNITKPWTGVTSTIHSYTDENGIVRPWLGVKSTINSYQDASDSVKQAAPWKKAYAKIVSYEDKDDTVKSAAPWKDAYAKIVKYEDRDNQVTKPWKNAQAKVTKYEDTDNVKKPWKDAWAKITKYEDKTDANKRPWKGVTATISKISVFEGAKSWLEQKFKDMGIKVPVAPKTARGGVYSSGGWHNVPQYATGGLPNHGTMFVAGEAGAEVVGHINGRTEVLNASQIASAIHAAVLSAMQQANNGQSPILNVTVRTEDNEVLARAVTRGQRSLDARLNPTAAY